jgi:hypothetical protein
MSAILKEVLPRTLGDDQCFAKVVSRDRSDGGRAEDHLVLARLFERMERQFALRAEERAARSADSRRPVVLRVPPPRRRTLEARGCVTAETLPSSS